MGTTVREPVLRRLSKSDIPDVAVIENTNQPRPWSERIIREELEGDNRVYLAILAGDALLGFGGVIVMGEEAHITNLLVAPDQRRKGFARRILVGLIDIAVEMGARHLTLEVRSKNDAAIALYRKFGLGPVGVRKDYYGDDDAMIMWAYEINGADFGGRMDGLR